MLGHLRKHIPAQVGEIVVAEIGKDILNVAPKDIGSHFEEYLAP